MTGAGLALLAYGCLQGVRPATRRNEEISCVLLSVPLPHRLPARKVIAPPREARNIITKQGLSDNVADCLRQVEKCVINLGVTVAV